MKRLFKFFPVALAVVALASCSSDDLQTANGLPQEEFDPSKLYVTIEGEDDANVTRAGFTEGSTATGGLTRKTIFTKNDEIKIYHNETNWRPQLWKYTGDAQVAFTNSEGVTGIFTTSSKAGETVPEYVTGYGIYPSNLGSFDNEDRTKMTFDLSALKVMDYKTQPSVAYADRDYNMAQIIAPMPMWGYAQDSKMKLKYLTAYVRYETYIPADGAANTVRYLVIQSNGKKLNGKFSVNVDPEKLMDEQPELATAAITGPATDLSATGAGVDAFTGAEDIILVNLGQVKKGGLVVYVPITAGQQKLDFYMSSDVTKPAAAGALTLKVGTNLTASPVNLTADDILARNTQLAKNNSTIKANDEMQRAGFYNVVDDSQNKNTTATSPFQMVQAIIAADKEAYRDFEITFTNPILVDNSDAAPQRQWIDFQNTVANYGLGEAYNLKHKVTVKATLKGVAANQVLNIKNIGGEKLTLNITQDGTNPVNINVTDGLTSELVLDGTLNNVTNASSGKLTIAGAVAAGLNVTTSGEITIDESTTTNAVDLLVIQKGCTKVNVLDGIVTKASFAPYTATNNKQIAADVEFHTEGTGKLTEVDYTNVPKATDGKTFAKTISYTSKWDGKTSEAGLTTISCGAENVKGLNVLGTAIENVSTAITSAAQLAGYNSAAATRILAKEIDLDGKALENTTPLAQAVNGNYNVFANSADAAAAAAIAQANIKNLQIGVAGTVLTAGAHGLFQTAAASAAIYNLKISDAKILGKIGTISANIGTLIGQTTAAVTVKNVDVTGLTVNITGATDYASSKSLNIGGVIGEVTGGKAAMLDVTTTGAISANGSLGGIIGKVSNTATAQFGEEVNAGGKFNAANMCSSTISLTPTAGQAEYDPVYAMVGTFVGSNDYATAGTAGVEIYTKTALTPSIAVPEKAKFSRITSTFAILRYNIERGLDEVGFSGFTDYATATNWLVKVFVSNNGTAAATAKDYVTKAYTTTAPNTNGWTIANWAALTTPVYCGWNISTQYVTE